MSLMEDAPIPVGTVVVRLVAVVTLPASIESEETHHTFDAGIGVDGCHRQSPAEVVGDAAEKLLSDVSVLPWVLAPELSIMVALLESEMVPS